MNKSTMRIEWDDSKLKEIDEAKRFYLKARQENRRILSAEGAEIETFKPSLRCIIIDEVLLSPDDFAVRILDETGDRRLIWDTRDPSQVKEAEDTFEKYLAKGWKAYAVDKKGNQKHRIFRFDWKKEEVHFDDKGKTKERFEKFIRAFKDVKLVPRTYPG